MNPQSARLRKTLFAMIATVFLIVVAHPASAQTTHARPLAGDGAPDEKINESSEPRTAPVITSAPVTEATVGQPYTYTVTANGEPAPRFQLSASPTGMTINPNTGVIGWTPAAAGRFDVTVLATNATGTTSQSFKVQVVNAVDLASCPADMIAYWQLEEVNGSVIFSDVYGGYHATCEGVNCPEVAGGQVGEAQYFDGNNRIYISDSSAFNWGHDDGFSVEAWVNTKQICAINSVFVGKWRTQGTYTSWWLGCSEEGKAAFVVRDSDKNYVEVLSPELISDDHWHHVAGVRSASTSQLHLYVDGQLVNSVPTNYTGDFVSAAPVNFGYYIESYYYVGFLDDIAIYNRELAASEFQEHHQNGRNGVGYCPTPLAETAPVITSSPVTEAVAGELYEYDVDATGSPLPAFALVEQPAGMTIDAVSGRIEWTPAVAGVYTVTAQASNSAGSADQRFSIAVTETAQAPAITSSPVLTALVGTTYRYQVNATGNPPPTFDLVESPDSMIINPSTGLITWIPGKAGPYPVAVEAINHAGSVSQTFTISATEPLRMPLITSSPVTGAVVGEAYIYDVEATGNPSPTFQLVDGPAGMTIDGVSGLINWMPAAPGSHNVEVAATNNAGAISQDFTLVVAARRLDRWLPLITRE